MSDEQNNDKEPVKDTEQMPIEEIRNQAVSLIQTCYDPEIPVNIWELGLVYEVNIKENNDIEVIMSLTSPFCPAAQSLPEEVKTKLQEIEGVNDVTVEITFDPPWTTEMMSEEARLELGFM
ncbi:MAG: iron-sulfur cluster assembly protein [Chitinophagaceae bacterium]